MRFTSLAAFVLSSLLLNNRAFAFSTDLNVFYFSDGLAAASTSSVTRTIWDFALLLNLTKKGDIVAGWSYGSVSTSDAATTTTTYTSSEMGPKFGYYFDKHLSWVLFLTYNLNTKINYNNGTTIEEWRGSSLKAELGYLPHVTDEFAAGIKLVYYKPTIAEAIPSSNVLSKVSYSRTLIYPSISFTYFF